MDRNYFFSSRCRGFTLIELLVVIAIIVLLVSILVPSLQRARQMAQIAVCGMNVRSLAAAHTNYAIENNSFISLLREGGSYKVKQFNNVIGSRGNPVPRIGSAFGPLWADQYIASPESFFCPGNTIYAYTWEAMSNDDTDGTYWFDTPNVANDSYMTIGYGVRPVATERFAYGSGKCVLPRMNTMKGNEAIVTDLNSTPWHAKGHHYPKINVGAIGGSVTQFDANDYPAEWHDISDGAYSAVYSDIFLTDDGEDGIWVQMDG